MRNVSLSSPLTGFVWKQCLVPTPSQDTAKHCPQPGVEQQSQGSHPESCLPTTSSHFGGKTVLILSLSLLLLQNRSPQPIYNLQAPLFLPKLTLLISNTIHNPLDFVPEMPENKATKSGFRGLGSTWHRTHAYKNFSPPHLQIFLETNTKLVFSSSLELRNTRTRLILLLD